MAVAYLDAVARTTATATGGHMAYTVSPETDRALIVLYSHEGSAATSTFTYGGVPMTHIGASDRGLGSSLLKVRAAIAFEEDIAAAASNVIACQTSATVLEVSIHARSFSGVSQVLVPSVVFNGSASASPNPIPGTIDATANSAVLAISANGAAGSANWVGVTEETSAGVSGNHTATFASILIVTASTVPTACTWNSGNTIVLFAFNLEPAVAAASNTPIAANRASYLKIGTGGRFDRDILT